MKRKAVSNAGGFTLVELMVAMVLGLIVIGAVGALVLSMIRTNKQTIQSTRLTQELRATSAVITSELQRAGGVGNPFELSGVAAYNTINTSTAGCIVYKYSFYDDSDTLVIRDRAISLSGNAVYIGTTCGSGGSKLSSNNVNITALTFARPSARRITVTLTGQMVTDGTTVTRSYSQSVFTPGLGT